MVKLWLWWDDARSASRHQRTKGITCDTFQIPSAGNRNIIKMRRDVTMFTLSVLRVSSVIWNFTWSVVYLHTKPIQNMVRVLSIIHEQAIPAIDSLYNNFTYCCILPCAWCSHRKRITEILCSHFSWLVFIWDGFLHSLANRGIFCKIIFSIDLILLPVSITRYLKHHHLYPCDSKFGIFWMRVQRRTSTVGCCISLQWIMDMMFLHFN